MSERIKIGGKTQKQLDAEHAAEEQVRMSEEARAYLRDTDWYVLRLVETNVIIPREVREKRQAARDRVK